MKPKYEDEKKLLSYIKSLVGHRDDEAVRRYIEARLSYYSFSDDFMLQCQKIQDILNADTKTKPLSNMSKIKAVEPLPEIFFNQLSDSRERNHLRLTQEHVKNTEAELFDEIDQLKEKMEDLKVDIRYSTNDDRPFIAKEYSSMSNRRQELRDKASYVTTAINHPYFGRFDFRDADKKEKILYISKTNIPAYVNNHHDVHFIDWREPIVDLFYRYQSPTNNVNFNNDAGETIHGDMALTARFTIENGTIKNISYSASRNDSTVSEAASDILQKKLSSNSSEYMTEIVETIQPEQNSIVRHDPNEDMVVQGVAGSGKTAVALHRIAYIVYQKPELRRGGILFISPNEAFSKYVSDVLPELGEFYIPIMTFNDVANSILHDKISDTSRFQSETIQEFVENYYKKGILNKTIKSKFTVAFINKFYSLCRRIEKEGELINRYLKTRSEIESIKHDIDEYRKMIKSISNIERIAKYSQEQKRLQEKLTQFRKVFTAIRKKIEQQPEIYSMGIGKGEKAGEIIVTLAKKPIDYYETICGDEKIKKKSYENMPFMAILRFLVDKANGKNREDLSVRHIVIDEAQDYIEPYIYFLRIAYPNAVFTILGDINQNINPYYMHGSLEKLLPNSEYFEMDKAFRSSPEIIEFCNNILGLTSVKAVRHSNGETVESLNSPADGVEIIKPAVDYYRNKGYERIGIITRDQESADVFTRTLKDNQLIILPVYQAKGLEFDAAIVINDFKDKEKELFYVASSRAQHGLTIIKRKVPKKSAKTKNTKAEKISTKKAGADKVSAKEASAKKTKSKEPTARKEKTEKPQAGNTPTKKHQTEDSRTESPRAKKAQAEESTTEELPFIDHPADKPPVKDKPAKKSFFSKLKSASKAAFKAFKE